MAVPLVEAQNASINEETDLELAEQAIPASLKMMEGMLKEDPGNEILLGRLAEGFCRYAFGFVEDDDPDRASNLYLRGRDYAVRELAARSGPEGLVSLNIEPFKARLNEIGPDHLHALYWMGQCWANWLMLNLDDMQAFLVTPKVEAAMQRVLDLDGSFEFAGSHTFFGAYFGGRPKMLGGDAVKAKTHFDQALEITQRRFLIIHILYAKTLAIQTQDKKLFVQLLNEVVKAPEDLLPGQQLANAGARFKAQKLLESTDDFF